MKTLTQLTVREIESVELPVFDSSYFPQEHFIEDILQDLTLQYYKNSANTGTVYFDIAYDEDRTIKLRLANHKKSNYVGREVDAEIIYDESMTESDIYNLLYQELSGRL